MRRSRVVAVGTFTLLHSNSTPPRFTCFTRPPSNHPFSSHHSTTITGASCSRVGFACVRLLLYVTNTAAQILVDSTHAIPAPTSDLYTALPHYLVLDLVHDPNACTSPPAPESRRNDKIYKNEDFLYSSAVKPTLLSVPSISPFVVLPGIKHGMDLPALRTIPNLHSSD